MWHISQVTHVMRTDTLARVSDRTTHEIAVIGAGTTGASIAYHLTQRGRRPLLLDRAGAAGGPSGASAGMLRQHYDEPAIIELARFGCGFLAEMDELTGFPSGFVGCGYVVVAGAEQEARVRATHDAMRAADVRVELLDVAGLRSLEPRLHTDDLAIGCYEPAVGYCEPLFVADGLAAAAGRDGATLCLDREVRSVARDGGGYRLELDSGGTILAETCIVAAGAWSNELLGTLGGAVPLTLRRGQIGRYCPPASFGAPGPIVSDHLLELWMRPDGPAGHYLVGGRGGRADDELPEPERAVRGADPERLADFARELHWRLPAMAGGIWRGSWSSFYDFTPDGNPVVDRVPGHDGLIVATGGSGHAFKLAPALGLGVAELVCDGDVQSFDWSLLRFGRFG
jgi:sarcosine oxidase, subunit beta